MPWSLWQMCFIRYWADKRKGILDRIQRISYYQKWLILRKEQMLLVLYK